nr:putative membrane protein [Quercus suber]
MDTSDAAFEAEVDLDREAVQRREDEGRPGKGGMKSALVAKGGLDASIETARDTSDENSPLLPQDDGDSDNDRYQDIPNAWTGGEDFAHLAWNKRPSVLWMLPPFFLIAIAFGGAMTPKINLILQLICRQYISERQSEDPNFIMAPVDFSNGGSNDQCRIPEVQARVSTFMLWASLIAGLISAITSPKLGALSDRYGRKPILIFTSGGLILSELFTIFAAKYPESFPVELLLLGSALEGLSGSFILAMAIANAYATDCTPPDERSVVFGYFHGCLFTGLAIGPVLAGYVVRWTGQIVIVFYIMLGVHCFFVFFITIAVPESLSQKRRQIAKEKHKSVLEVIGPDWDWINQLRSLNLLEPLKILYPTGPGTSPALRRNLIILAAVDTIVFGVAMGSLTVVIIYTNFQFGWATFESGRFTSIVNSSRVFCLLVVLPVITRLIRGKPDMTKQRAAGSDTFDLSTIRIAVLFDTIGYLGYALSRSPALFTLSGVVAAIGGIGSPSLQSALTKHVSASQTGQLLGATGLLHSLARVIAPTVFNAIYSATVGKFTQTVFVCLTTTFGIAFLISWFIKPHGTSPSTFYRVAQCCIRPLPCFTH